MNALFFLLGIGIFVLSVYVHEFGHRAILKKYFPKAKTHFSFFPLRIYTGEEYMYEKLNPEQKFSIYYFGIILGIIPIAVFSLINQFYLLLLIPYAFGVEKDIRLMWRCKNG